jgi:hypothetical protein
MRCNSIDISVSINLVRYIYIYIYIYISYLTLALLPGEIFFSLKNNVYANFYNMIL